MCDGGGEGGGGEADPADPSHGGPGIGGPGIGGTGPAGGGVSTSYGTPVATEWGGTVSRDPSIGPSAPAPTPIGYGTGKVDPGLAAAAGIGPAASGYAGTTRGHLGIERAPMWGPPKDYVPSLVKDPAPTKEGVTVGTGLTRGMPTIATGLWGQGMPLGLQMNPAAAEPAFDWGSAVEAATAPAAPTPDADTLGVQARAPSYLTAPYQRETRAPLGQAPVPQTWVQWGEQRRA